MKGSQEIHIQGSQPILHMALATGHSQNLNFMSEK